MLRGTGWGLANGLPRAAKLLPRPGDPQAGLGHSSFLQCRRVPSWFGFYGPSWGSIDLNCSLAGCPGLVQEGARKL